MASLQIASHAHELLITVTGELSVPEILAVIRTHYPQLRCQAVLWDLEQAGMPALDLAEMRQISQEARRCLPPTLHPRIAYVCSEQTYNSIMCIYAALATIAENPAEYSVFREKAAARAWFASPEGSTPSPYVLKNPTK